MYEDFKNRTKKAKDVFFIQEITKEEAYSFIRFYHYLGDAKFFAEYSFGLFDKNTHILVGCATFSPPQGTVSLKGWFGLENDTTDVLELSRLCVLPELNGTNASSYILGNSIKMLKKYKIRAVITLADSSRHIGSIYQVCNFKYYGLTDKKTDFYLYEDGANPRARCETKVNHGVWINRTRKHRYAYILDKTLKCLYSEEPQPTEKYTIGISCCDGKKIVHDKRYDEWYTCPKCCRMFIKIDNSDALKIYNGDTKLLEDILLKNKSPEKVDLF